MHLYLLLKSAVVLEMDCITFKKKKIMGTGLKTEQESHMKMLTIVYHRTSGPRERTSAQLEVRALLLFCCLVCAKGTHSLINSNPQLPTVYREHFGTTWSLHFGTILVIANREEKKKRNFFFF